MAFGDGQPQEINAGIAAQPLVTSPDRSITDQSAVDRLAEAFRQGFITTQDIQQNIGMVGPRKKAELQKLSEFVNPEVVGSRMAQARAMGAQADLATQQAEAETALVEPVARLKGAQIEKEQAGVWQQEALAAYQSRGFRPIYKPDGTVDTDKMAVVGRELVDANVKMGYAQSMLSGKWVQEDHGDEVRQVLRNSLGEDVTPNPKNQTVKYYQKMMQDARKTLFNPLKEPDDSIVGRVPTEAQVAPRATTVSTVEPGLAKKDLDTFRSLIGTDLIKNGVSDGASVAAGMSDQDLLDYAAENLAKAGTAKKTTVNADGSITIEEPGSAAAADAPAAEEGSFGFASPKPGYFRTPEEITKSLNDHPAFKQWNDSKATMGTFKANANAAPSVTSDQQLAAAVAQLADPQANALNFDFKKLINDKPALEEIGRIWSKATGETAMSPEARQRLIDAGNRIIRAKESAVRPQLQLAQTRWNSLPPNAKKSGPPLDSWDMQTLGGAPAAAAGTPAQRSKPPGAIDHQQGGKSGYILNGQFYAYKQQ